MRLITSIEEGLEYFKKNRVIIFPTETVYGLGAMAADDQGVREIFRIKNRPASNPLIIHFISIEQIEEYCHINELEKRVLSHYAPGPITLLLKKKNKDLFKLATHSSSYICARIPKGQFAYELIKRFGPIAAPSANLSGQLTLTSQAMVEASYSPFNIGCYVNDDIIGGVESTIVQIEEGKIIILRKGLISRSSLETLAPVVYSEELNHNNNSVNKVPGTRFLHYQIRKPLLVSNEKTFDCFHINIGDNNCDFNLSKQCNIQEIYKNYFYSLFLGDMSEYKKVSICEFPHDKNFDSLRDRLAKTLEKQKE